jgi:hypothetical protein
VGEEQYRRRPRHGSVRARRRVQAIVGIRPCSPRAVTPTRRSFPRNRAAHVDVGAQYWTRLSEYNDDMRGELLGAGALVPFADGKITQDVHRRADALDHAVSGDAKGFRAVVEGFLDGVLLGEVGASAAAMSDLAAVRLWLRHDGDVLKRAVVH